LGGLVTEGLAPKYSIASFQTDHPAESFIHQGDAHENLTYFLLLAGALVGGELGVC
jgi:hypothetical protein